MEICRTARTQHDMTGPRRREDKKGYFSKAASKMLHIWATPSKRWTVSGSTQHNMTGKGLGTRRGDLEPPACDAYRQQFKVDTPGNDAAYVQFWSAHILGERNSEKKEDMAEKRKG